MGAAGDMFSAALLELLSKEERVAFAEEFNALGIPGVHMSYEPSVKCGTEGTHVTVTVNGEEEEVTPQEHHDHQHEHHHGHHVTGHGMADIKKIVCEQTSLSDKVKTDIMNVYQLIAEAESKVHGEPVSEIHFHEVGNMDAIADVTMVCMLIGRLTPDRILASPVNTGSGHVHCAHGILPVPAPAVKLLLEGIPSYSNGIESELCTPTGAALIRHFADITLEPPRMSDVITGRGMGKKDFDVPNCVSVYYGEEEQ